MSLTIHFFSLSSQNINSTDFNSPLSKLTSAITKNSSKKRDIEELKIDTQYDDSKYIFIYNIYNVLRQLKNIFLIGKRAKTDA
jgi:hypothetical protein